MTDKPIIFSGPMIRALLAGTKTRMRRVLKPQPEERANGLWHVFNRYGGSAGVHVDQVGEVAADTGADFDRFECEACYGPGFVPGYY